MVQKRKVTVMEDMYKKWRQQGAACVSGKEARAVGA